VATTVGVQWVFNLLVVVRNIGTYQVQINFFVCKSCKLQSESLDQHPREVRRESVGICKSIIRVGRLMEKLPNPPNQPFDVFDVDPVVQIEVCTVCTRGWFALDMFPKNII